MYDKYSDQCTCLLTPLDSKCGDWDGNTSACLCADLGVSIETNQSLPG